KYGEKKEFKVCCKKCNTPFTVIEREKNFPSKEKYFCSRSCANRNFRKLESKIKTSDAIRAKYGTEEHRCKFCNKQTYKFLRKSVFCSEDCKQKNMLKRREEKRAHLSEYKKYRKE